MLKDNKEKNYLLELLCSLYIWKKTSIFNTLDHQEYAKETGTLYRFGWFYINGYKYAIVSWQFNNGIVTFEEETTHHKIKYNIQKHYTLTDEFKKDAFLISIKKKVLNCISSWLKDLSDKLRV